MDSVGDVHGSINRQHGLSSGSGQELTDRRGVLIAWNVFPPAKLGRRQHVDRVDRLGIASSLSSTFQGIRGETSGLCTSGFI